METAGRGPGRGRQGPPHSDRRRRRPPASRRHKVSVALRGRWERHIMAVFPLKSVLALAPSCEGP